MNQIPNGSEWNEELLGVRPTESENGEYDGRPTRLGTCTCPCNQVTSYFADNDDNEICWPQTEYLRYGVLPGDNEDDDEFGVETLFDGYALADENGVTLIGTTNIPGLGTALVVYSSRRVPVEGLGDIEGWGDYPFGMRPNPNPDWATDLGLNDADTPDWFNIDEEPTESDD